MAVAPDNLSGADGDLPEAASRRGKSNAFSSGLSVPDFAACLQMGIEPVELVQGYCVMQWGWYSVGSPYMRGVSPMQTGLDGSKLYSENWRCPHGFVSSDHRSWGQNYEQPWIENAWGLGFNTAYTRMLEEARSVGAQGVIGVVDISRPLADMGVLEFHAMGTAVRVKGVPTSPNAPIWTTYLAGQRLAKLIEAGFMPISIVAALSSVRVWAYCITEYLTEGGAYSSWGSQLAGGEIEQTAKAHMAARQVVREHVRNQLGSDILQGADLTTRQHEVGAGDQEIQCTLKGNRVRRFKEFDQVPAPRPTVRLL